MVEKGDDATLKDTRLGVIESRFADIIWNNEPITTAQLVKLCEEELGWKRTTTYTVLKRLSDKGLFTNTDGVVTSLISRDGFYALQSENYIEESFGGSLPAFLTAFTSKKRLSKKDISEIRKLIDAFEEEC